MHPHDISTIGKVGQHFQWSEEKWKPLMLNTLCSHLIHNCFANFPIASSISIAPKMISIKSLEITNHIFKAIGIAPHQIFAQILMLLFNLYNLLLRVKGSLKNSINNIGTKVQAQQSG